jgi:tetratricopeptide (TPR) repeat protein
MAENKQIQKAVDKFVLFKTDAEKEGQDLAKEFGITGYPTYIVLDGKNNVIDRWSGYEADAFLKRTETLLADFIPIEKKLDRFAAAPTLDDALLVAEYHLSTGDYGAAVGAYRKAAELDPASDHVMDIFYSSYYGFRDDMFSTTELTTAADAALASSQVKDDDLVLLAQMMTGAARRAEKPQLAAPYLEAAIARTENTTDPDLQESRREILPDYALVVKKDPEKAFAYKKDSLGEGWEENPNQLNSIAWWCFENKIHLDEGYAYAKHGAELADPGADRAMILDTQAEICNAMDDCHQAMEIMKQALAEAPGNARYEKQLKRFSDLVAEKQGKK